MITAFAELHDIVGPVPIEEADLSGWYFLVGGLLLIAAAVVLGLWLFRKKAVPEPGSARIQRLRMDLLQAESAGDLADMQAAIKGAISAYTGESVSSRTAAELRSMSFADAPAGQELLDALQQLEEARFSGSFSQEAIQQVVARAAAVFDTWAIQLLQKETAERRGGRA